MTETGALLFETPKLVGPGQTAFAFYDTIMDDAKKSDLASAEAEVRWREAEDPGPQFEVTNVRLKQASDGGIDVSGLLKNISTETVDNALVAVFLYDANGKLRGVAYSGSGVDNLDPGDRKGFTTNPTPPIKLRDVKEWKAFAIGL